jgi:hypothetical protein
MSTIEVSKLDAARRQIEVAITLYFNDDDPVAIHTLTGAAYNLLRDVNKSKNGQPLFFKDFLINELVKPEFKSEAKRIINRPENFFKHADRDPDNILEFKTSVTEELLHEAGCVYERLTGDSLPLVLCFHIWYMIIRPEDYEYIPDKYEVLLKGKSYNSEDKAVFYRETMTSIEKAKC